ncbi:hypothetical protein NHX12_020013 [Muraenolepis orangiensis]|uniref:Uncharacterized protein n=1 Tax=Muraenolepis orangiensis TaxID=630683 RepID=A0A9Q0IUF8_9TELE|nr:hypothetical protein NHX12_020013 [Muraenolepis orangiensis]
MAVSAMLNRNLSTTFPFLSTIDLDLAGLKRIRAHSTSSSSPFRIHRQPGTDSVMTVRSSMNALMGGCRCPEFVRGSLHSGSADLELQKALDKRKAIVLSVNLGVCTVGRPGEPGAAGQADRHEGPLGQAGRGPRGVDGLTADCPHAVSGGWALKKPAVLLWLENIDRRRNEVVPIDPIQDSDTLH